MNGSGLSGMGCFGEGCFSRKERKGMAQLMNYLKATGLEHGLLLNFGSEKFQCRKIARAHI